MGLGGLIEPLVVVTLLFGGTWINRNRSYRLSRRPRQPHNRVTSPSVLESGLSSPSLQSDSSSSPSSSSSSPTSSSYSYSSDDGYEVPTRISPSRLPTQGGMRWRRREIELLGWRREVATPDTRVFRGRLLSRLLRRFPFLVEAWYWALIYWVSGVLFSFFFAFGAARWFCALNFPLIFSMLLSGSLLSFPPQPQPNSNHSSFSRTTR